MPIVAPPGPPAEISEDARWIVSQLQLPRELTLPALELVQHAIDYASTKNINRERLLAYIRLERDALVNDCLQQLPAHV